MFSIIKSVVTTDHKIKSVSIFRFTIICIFAMSVLLIIGELTVDFNGINLGFFLFFTAALGILIILTFFFGMSDWLTIAFTLILYLHIEWIAIAYPQSYHYLNYWFFFVPLVALVSTGVRNALYWLLICSLSIIFNSFYVDAVSGAFYETQQFSAPSMVGGLIFLICAGSATFMLYKLLVEAYGKMKSNREELYNLKYKLELNLNAICELSKNPSIQSGDVETMYKLICEVSKNILKVSRVSIWEYRDNPERIERAYLYEVDGKSDEKVTLLEKDFPIYFKSIKNEKIVFAENAHTNTDTAEFSDIYLTPLNIKSMLDASFEVDNQFAGVICCENKHHKMHWTSEDMLFIRSMSDMIALVHKTRQINNFSVTVQNKNQEITNKRLEIEEINTELKLTNEQLEERVKERTKVLEVRNEQLTEYAFINSHMLRGPLSRIIGLSDLISRENIALKDKALMNKLIDSTTELDSVVRKVAKLLNGKSPINREQIKDKL